MLGEDTKDFVLRSLQHWERGWRCEVIQSPRQPCSLVATGERRTEKMMLKTRQPVLTDALRLPLTFDSPVARRRQVTGTSCTRRPLRAARAIISVGQP